MVGLRGLTCPEVVRSSDKPTSAFAKSVFKSVFLSMRTGWLSLGDPEQALPTELFGSLNNL